MYSSTDILSISELESGVSNSVPDNSLKNILIVGAGLSGLAAAIGLRKAKYEVTILERNPELQEIGAGIQLPANSCRILHELGVLDRVKELSVEPQSLVIRSYRGPKLYTQILGSTISEKFHYPHLLIHRADIRRILFDETIANGAMVHFNACIKHVNPTTGTVELESGNNYTADLIIGADGEHSICREALLGRRDAPHSSGDVVYRIAVPSALIEADPAIAGLVHTPTVHAWYGPQSHAVCYQLQKGGIFNIVLTLPEAPDAIEIGPQVADLAYVRQFCSLWDPQFRRLLDLADGALKWTLLQTNELTNWSHSSGKMILIGDSAHASLPYLAQGAALALESAYTLSILLAHHPTQESMSSLLAAYSAMRLSRTTAARYRSKHMHDTCQLSDGPEQRERDRVFREEMPGGGFPNPWADPGFQSWMWGFDARVSADECWNRWKPKKS